MDRAAMFDVYSLAIQVVVPVIGAGVIVVGMRWQIRFLIAELQRLSVAVTRLSDQLALLRDDHGQRIASLEGKIGERPRR